MELPDDFDWRDVIDPQAGKSTMGFGKKNHLKGWTMQHAPNHWVARTVAGDRADFDNEEDAKAFLKLVLHSTPED